MIMESKEASDDKNENDEKNCPRQSKEDTPNQRTLIAEAKEENDLSGKYLIRRVCEFYFDDENLQHSLEQWAGENSKCFSPFDTEYSLKQMTLFEDFRALLEDKLESFVRSLGASVDTLRDEIATDKSNDFYSGNTLVEVINASVNFKNFHAMMCDARAGEFIWGIPPLQDVQTGDLHC